MKQPPMLTVIYDGHCAICNASKAKIERWLGDRVETIDFRVIAPEQIHPELSAERCQAQMHVLEAGRLYGAAAAVVRVLRHHPVYRYLVWLYRVPPFGSLAEVVYRFVSRNRFRFSKWFGRWLGKKQPVCTDACTIHWESQPPRKKRER